MKQETLVLKLWCTELETVVQRGTIRSFRETRRAVLERGGSAGEAWVQTIKACWLLSQAASTSLYCWRMSGGVKTVTKSELQQTAGHCRQTHLQNFSKYTELCSYHRNLQSIRTFTSASIASLMPSSVSPSSHPSPRQPLIYFI